jgi:hypothetical protein
LVLRRLIESPWSTERGDAPIFGDKPKWCAALNTGLFGADFRDPSPLLHGKLIAQARRTRVWPKLSIGHVSPAPSA